MEGNRTSELAKHLYELNFQYPIFVKVTLFRNRDWLMKSSEDEVMRVGSNPMTGVL